MSQMAHSIVNATCDTETLATWVGSIGTILAVVGAILIGQLQLRADRKHRANDRARARLNVLNIICTLADALLDLFVELRSEVEEGSTPLFEIFAKRRDFLTREFGRVEQLTNSIPVDFFSDEGVIGGIIALQRWVFALKNELNSVPLVVKLDGVLYQSLMGDYDVKFATVRALRDSLKRKFDADQI